MSFGVGLGDIALLIGLAKTTVANCRSAPGDFAEASRAAQSLYLILDGVATEYHNLDSPLHKDERTRTDFALHFKNCEMALQPLADCVTKFSSLGSTNVRVIDRFRFPRKELIELRGNLSFYTARLSEFLQMIGLGTLGRVEKKLEDMKDFLPQIMAKIDQMGAELRINGDRDSLLSDHTDDEKLVWKTFRRRLIEAGFKSATLREHEASIFLRIRELNGFHLLDSDAGTTMSSEYEETITLRPAFRFGARGSEPTQDCDAQSEATITPKPSTECLRDKSYRDSRQPGCSNANDQNGQKQVFSEPPVDVKDYQALHDHDDNHVTKMEDRTLSEKGHVVSQAPMSRARSSSSNESPTRSKTTTLVARIWHSRDGNPILKATFVEQRGDFLVVLDHHKQEVQISLSRLCEEDLCWIQSQHNIESCPNDSPEVSVIEPNTDCHDVSSIGPPASVVGGDEVIDIRRRTGPEILVGRRSPLDNRWRYRTQVENPTPPIPSRFHGDFLSDKLPSAAAKGHLNVVKRLIRSGYNIEATGPKSWDEPSKDSEGNPTTIRHPMPETTALYRAAEAGYFEIVLLLLENGANVNTRNGYNGRMGRPVLFQVVAQCHEKVARLLLEYGATQGTVLCSACHLSTYNIVKLLLDFGAAIDSKQYGGETPLYLASVRGHAGMVKLLLEEGASCNKLTSEGKTPLYKAAGQSKVKIVRYLLRYGADSSLGRGRHGETTIYKVAWNGQADILDLLLDYGADCNLQNDLQMASYSGVLEKFAHGIISGMAGMGGHHALMNAWGKTALHAAAYRGYDDIVQILLENGAKVDAVGTDGNTALYLAANEKHREVVERLLKAGSELQTERHDPVLALISEKNRDKKQTKSRELNTRSNRASPKEMAKMGTEDPMVGFLANVARNMLKSRR